MRISDWSSDVCSSDLLGLDDADIGFLYGTAFAVFYALFGVPLGRLAEVVDDHLRPAPRPFERIGAAEPAAGAGPDEIGRASCRERVCQYGEISVVAGPLEKKQPRERATKKKLH